MPVNITPLTLSAADTEQFRSMIEAARLLAKPDIQYTRGQADLIAYLLGLDSERTDEIVAAIKGAPFAVETLITI
jgi:hypothetical protein